MENGPKLPVGLSAILSVAGAYALLVSALYLLGYWGAFKLNVFEYIGPSDLLTHAIFPFFVPLLAILVGMTVPRLLGMDRVLPPGGGVDTPSGRWLARFEEELYAATLILIFLFAWFGREPFKWMIVASLIAVLSNPITKIDYFIDLLPNPRLRATLLMAAFFVPGAAFAFGRLYAWDVKRGGGDLFVEPASELAVDQHHPVSYLGRLGDCFVLYEVASGRLIIVRTDKVGSLTLGPKPAK